MKKKEIRDKIIKILTKTKLGVFIVNKYYYTLNQKWKKKMERELDSLFEKFFNFSDEYARNTNGSIHLEDYDILKPMKVRNEILLKRTKHLFHCIDQTDSLPKLKTFIDSAFDDTHFIKITDDGIKTMDWGAEVMIDIKMLDALNVMTASERFKMDAKVKIYDLIKICSGSGHEVNRFIEKNYDNFFLKSIMEDAVKESEILVLTTRKVGKHN